MTHSLIVSERALRAARGRNSYRRTAAAQLIDGCQGARVATVVLPKCEVAPAADGVADGAAPVCAAMATLRAAL